MKKLFAITLSLIVVLSFAFQKNATTTTPSVKTVISSEMTADTSDLDGQMRELEAQMRVLEKQMKPFEAEMKEQEKKMKPLERLMKDKERELKASGFDKSVGDEMGRIGDQMGKIGDEMSKIGNKMSSVGDEMSKIGDKMSIVGDKMAIRHKRVFSWLFNELKKDGLLKLDADISILIENNVMVVNGKTLDAAQLEKYKKGIESRNGKPLKSDFSFYFKGQINSLSDDSYESEGNMNTHF